MTMSLMIYGWKIRQLNILRSSNNQNTDYVFTTNKDEIVSRPSILMFARAN